MRSYLVFLALTTLLGAGCGPDGPQSIEGDWFGAGGLTGSLLGYRFKPDGQWVNLAPVGGGDYCEDKDWGEYGTYEWRGSSLTLVTKPLGIKYTASVGISGDSASVSWTSTVKPLMAESAWRRRDDVTTVDTCR